MVKNFFVKTQVVKNKKRGLSNYINYLLNTEHKNHKGKTERILELRNEDFLKTTLMSIKKKEIENTNNKKGGSSFQSYRQSFCLSFPTDIKEETLTEEILKKIYIEVIRDIFKNMGIPIEKKYLDLTFGNVHYNNNIHINIVLPKVMEGKTYDYSKKSLLNVIKNSFDYQCERIGVSKEEYTPKTTNMTKKTIKQYEMGLERKKIYLMLERELIELKQMKNEMINSKTDIEIKKDFYNRINPLIGIAGQTLKERNKKIKKYDNKVILEKVKTDKERITEMRKETKKIIQEIKEEDKIKEEKIKEENIYSKIKYWWEN